MVAAVALMALVSCNKEEINSGVQEPASDIVFVAEFEQEADTKIALGELVDGVRKTTWVAGDQIKINGTVFSAQADGASTAFKTTTAFDETAKTFRAVYPALSYISTTAVDIPASQNGTFAGASIAVAESSTTSLTFQNLVTILKFRVPVNCSKVTFESTESIAGRITVNYTDGVMTPDYAGVTQYSKTINVTGTFVPGTDYYVAVKPDTHTFTVKIDGNVSKESTKSVTVERSKILNMGVLPKPKANRNLAFSSATATAYLGQAFTAPTLSGVKDGVTYTSTNPAVATVDASTGAVNVIAEGKATIKASAEATEEYAAGSASYELSVEYLLTDWNLKGTFGVINMEKSTVYTDLYVAKNVTLNSTNKFVFVNKDKSKTVGAWGASTANVDVKGQINTWYGSDATPSYAANIYVSTAAQYDVYFSPANLDFLIIKTGVEEVDTEWALVGSIGGQVLWNSTKHKIKLNYILVEKSITIDLTNKDYFKFLKNNNWTAGGTNSGWIAGFGSDDNGTTDLTIANNATSTYGSHRSWGDYRSRFHMTNNGTYKITLVIDEGNAYGDATITFKRLK